MLSSKVSVSDLLTSLNSSTITSIDRPASPNVEHERGSLHRLPGMTLITEWPQGSFVENLAAKHDGHLLVTVYSRNEIYEVDSTLSKANRTLLVTLPAGPTGIVELDFNHFYVNVGSIGQRNTWSIYRISVHHGNPSNASFKHVVDIESALFLNGLCVLSYEHGTLLSVDSMSGKIFKVNVNTKQVEVWFTNDLLKKQSHDLFMPGINGIRRSAVDDYLYFSNTDRALMLRLAIDPFDYRPKGQLETIAKNIVCDDFTIDRMGALYATTHVQNSLMRLTPVKDGEFLREELGTLADGLAGATSCVFGRTYEDRTWFYSITNVIKMRDKTMRIIVVTVFLFMVGSTDERVISNQKYWRGSNYIRLVNQSMHATFEPNLYSTWQIETALQQMQSYEYNYVRVFLDCPTLYQGFGLSSPGVPFSYTKNVIDFLVRAWNHNISVMLTASWNPANYQSIIDSYPLPANVTGINTIVFHEGQTMAKAQFFQDLLSEIKQTNQTAFENIFAIDIFNEICISVREQPFSLTDGQVSFNGVWYDMANGNDRQRLLDLSGNIWLNTVAATIKMISNDILVTASLFSPNAVGHDGFDGVQIRPLGQDDRYPLRPASLVYTLADYIDLHVYASNNAENELKGADLPTEKPLLMGETGAYTGFFSNASDAASAIKKVMTDSFDYRFIGWGVWTWDSTDQEPRFWTLTDQNNTLNNVLAPSVWPIGRNP